MSLLPFIFSVQFYVYLTISLASIVQKRRTRKKSADQWQKYNPEFYFQNRAPKHLHFCKVLITATVSSCRYAVRPLILGV